jgi:hypothetical protein
MNDSLLHCFFEKNSSKPPSSSSLIFSWFTVHIEWFWTWRVPELGLYKTSLYSKNKDVMIKNFKLKNLICLNSPIIKHPIFSSFFYHIEQFLWCCKNWVEGYKRYLSFRGKRNNVWVFPSQHNYWRIVRK